MIYRWFRDESPDPAQPHPKRHSSSISGARACVPDEADGPLDRRRVFTVCALCSSRPKASACCSRRCLSAVVHGRSGPFASSGGSREPRGHPGTALSNDSEPRERRLRWPSGSSRS